MILVKNKLAPILLIANPYIMKKSILWFAKNSEVIKMNGILFDLKNPQALNGLSNDMKSIYQTCFNHELDVFSYAFKYSKWDLFWTCLDFINETDNSIILYEPVNEKYLTIPLENLNNLIDFTIFKYLGSVESQRDLIIKKLNVLEKFFKGVIINHPDTIRYAIRKDYLLELKKAGFPIIDNTLIYQNTVSYNELVDCIDKSATEYIIKPVTGELANSLSILDEINEDWLRKKESKVGGWIIQPINYDVWNGEYRLVFFGSVCSLGQRKRYLKKEENQKIPSEKFRVFQPYIPNNTELELALEVRDFWENQLGKKIYTFRFDFIKSNENIMKILEFEAVNPGFGFHVISEKEQKRVAQEYVSFLNYYNFK